MDLKSEASFRENQALKTPSSTAGLEPQKTIGKFNNELNDS